MKKLFVLSLLMSFSLLLVSCSKDDNTVTPPAPTYKISGTVMDAQGSFLAGVTIDLTGDAQKTTTSDASGAYTFETLNSGSNFTVTVSSPDYDFETESMNITGLSQDETVDFTAKDGIVGVWLSAGANVAPLLNTIFAGSGGVDSIYATFNSDNTYIVRQVNGDATVIAYAGTYSNSKSSTGNIFTIITDQTAPSVATSEGIYEIDRTPSPHSMQYEIVLTSGTQNVAPTPELGFGSTNGGIFGTANVQNYIRIQ
jgi:hypothetical protein